MVLNRRKGDYEQFRKINYNVLLSMKSLSEIHEYIIEREIYDVGWMIYEKKIDYLKKIFNLDLSEVDIIEKDLIEICEIRNLLVHNNGIITEKFKERIKNEKYKIGEKININKNLMDKTINSFHNVVTLIDREVKIKYFTQ